MKKLLLITTMVIYINTINAQTLTDIDGNVYKTITVGTQKWMQENLKTTHYSNGDSIANITDTAEWINLTSGAYSNYNNDSSNIAVHGRLYNGFTVIDSRNLCPTGWHVPTDSEWTALTTFLGGESIAGGKMKETGTAHWNSPNTGATNASGFSALASGGRMYTNGTFQYIGQYGGWWSSTEQDDSIHIKYRNIGYNEKIVGNYSSPKQFGFSVRCIENPVPDSVKYFGQTPPGNTAVKFAPGNVSMPKRGEYILTFSTNYDECYFSTYSSDYVEKYYRARRINNSWTSFTETPCFASFFSADGKKIIYEKAGDILMANDTTGGWAVPIKLPSPINSTSYDDSYSETTEGVKYICSNRPGGLGKQYEIWRIKPLTNQAENLVPIINSTPRNITPCIAPDESYLIYTQSNGNYEHLYISFNKGNNEWTNPLNMDKSGAGINTLFQTCPKISPDGKYLFFNKHNPDYADSSDIYWVSTSIIDTLKKIAFQTSVVNAPNSENLISVFPNPSEGVFTITLASNPAKNATAEIFTMDSKMALRQTLTNSSSAFDLSGYPEGMYILKVNTGLAIVNKKIIKK